MFYCHLNNRKAEIVEIEFLPNATRSYNGSQTAFSKNLAGRKSFPIFVLYICNILHSYTCTMHKSFRTRHP